MNPIVVVISGVLLTFPGSLSAQWMKTPDRSIPRTPDGEPRLSAPAPRAADGKPDLSGVWLADRAVKPGRLNVENMTFSRSFGNITSDLKPGEEVMQPWAAALLKQRLQNNGKDSPTANCQPTSAPMLNALPLPFKIVQTPGLIVILYEENMVFARSSSMVGSRSPIRSGDGWGIRAASGMGTPSLSTRSASTIEAGLMPWVTPRATHYT